MFRLDKGGRMHKVIDRTKLALLAILLAVGVSTPVAAQEKITVIEQATNNSFVDNNEEGDSVGDLLIFENSIYDAGYKNVIGYDSGSCIRIAVGEAWECTWTTSFEDGEIMVQGSFYDQGDSVLAITGGTGAYIGAVGELWVHPRKDDGTEYDFEFEMY